MSNLRETENLTGAGKNENLQPASDRGVKSLMTSIAVWANRCVFAYLTIRLLLLQFTAPGLNAYFSMYVSKQCHFTGYLLYAAIIYLFAAYSFALFQKKQFVTCVLQLISLSILAGIMLYPFTSINHVSLLPLIVMLQPIILLIDIRFVSFDDLHNIRGILWGMLILIVITPFVVAFMISPVLEKIIIYCVTALLFARLQLKIRAGESAQQRNYLAG